MWVGDRDVEYEAQLEFDLGNMMATDPSPLDPEALAKDPSGHCLEIATRITQVCPTHWGTSGEPWQHWLRGRKGGVGRTSDPDALARRHTHTPTHSLTHPHVHTRLHTDAHIYTTQLHDNVVSVRCGGQALHHNSWNGNVTSSFYSHTLYWERR
jgi:hypothetical protein